MSKFLNLLLLKGPESAPVPLPYFRIDYRNDPVGKLHALVYTKNKRMLKICFFFFYWPFTSIRNSLSEVISQGSQVAGKYHIPKVLQFLQMIKLSVLYNIPAYAYYKYGLWRQKARAKAHLYIQHHEICALLPLLNKTFDNDVINDKYLFYLKCQELEIPTIPIVAYFKEGKIIQDGEFPKADLFVKLVNLYRGIGAKKFIYDRETDRYFDANKAYSAKELIAYLKEWSLKNALIVQPSLRNHRAIETRYSNGSLNTLRVITSKFKNSKAQFLTSTFRMPVGDGIVDNMNGGGIASAVMGDGILHNTMSKTIFGDSITYHPDTEFEIEKSKLPFYHEMVSLALLSHDRFDSHFFIGWDIAMTDHGPVNVEGNLIWGEDIIQIQHDIPLGNTAFGKLYLQSLESLRTTPVYGTFQSDHQRH